MEKTQRKILIAIMLIIILVIICITILLIYFVKNNEDITNNKQETAKNEYENVFYEIDEIEVDNKIRLVDSQNQNYGIDLYFSTALLVVHHIPVRGTIGLLIIRTRGQLIVIPLGKE